LRLDPRFADAYFLLAMIAADHGQFSKAIKLIDKTLALSGAGVGHAEYLAHLARCHVANSDHVQAAGYAQQAADLRPKSSLTLDTIGVVYSRIGLHAKAVVYFKQAVAIKQDNPSYYYNLAASMKFIGDFPAAKAAYEKTVELAPDFFKAHAGLSSLGNISAQANHIPRLKKLIDQAAGTDDLLHLCHAIAKEHEALGNYPAAFTQLERAKSAKLAELNYRFAEDQEMFDSLLQEFSNTEHKFKMGHQTDEPLFVVGMPRTGTTLVERILSSHSRVQTAGELQHFGLALKAMSATTSNRVIDAQTVRAAMALDFSKLGKKYIDSTRAITGAAEKFIDKMPLNVLYAGFIIKALPQARIVCLDRNPLDTCVSNYRQLFAVNYSYYNYSYSLATTAKFYLLFYRLMTFWQATFPDNFYVVNYEELVASPEAEAKKMLAFCRLDWQPQCLAIENNAGPVATASAVQVRSPINSDSVGSWSRYDAYLDEVKAILTKGGLLNESTL